MGDALQQRYPDRRVYLVPEHNDVMLTARWQARLMGIRPLELIPLSPLRTLLPLIRACLSGLKARIPPLFS